MVVDRRQIDCGSGSNAAQGDGFVAFLAKQSLGVSRILTRVSLRSTDLIIRLNRSFVKQKTHVRIHSVRANVLGQTKGAARAPQGRKKVAQCASTG